MFKVPFRCDFELLGFALGEWKGDFGKLFDQRPLRRPIWSNNLIVIAFDNFFDRLVGAQVIVSRRGKDAVLHTDTGSDAGCMKRGVHFTP